MEGQQENQIKKQKPNINFLLFRIIVTIGLIISITIIKFLFNDAFTQIKKLYNQNIAVNITAGYFKNAGGN